MMKRLPLVCMIACATIFMSCKKSEEKPDNASSITGTYDMTSYITKTSNSGDPAPGNNLVVTKVDDNTVKVVIDYLDPKSSDVTLDKMVITKSGSDYNLSQTFSNASSTGKITGGTFNLDVNYTDGTYVKVIAKK